MADSDDIDQMIEDCEKRSEKLSDRESEFIDSIATLLRSGGSLTMKQISWLDQIWERIT
jgi:hypothetical protein